MATWFYIIFLHFFQSAPFLFTFFCPEKSSSRKKSFHHTFVPSHLWIWKYPWTLTEISMDIHWWFPTHFSPEVFYLPFKQLFTQLAALFNLCLFTSFKKFSREVEYEINFHNLSRTIMSFTCMQIVPFKDHRPFLWFDFKLQNIRLDKISGSLPGGQSG